MYVSIDIETTGLDYKNDQVLEIAAVIDIDKVTPINELPTFKCRLLYNQIQGQPYALALNAGILKDLAAVENLPIHSGGYVMRNLQKIYKDMNYYLPGFALNQLDQFLREYFLKGKYIAAGKNFAGFDKLFLDEIEELNFSHRVIDIGNLYLDADDEEKIPSLKECLKRAGVNKEVAHTALEDAQDVITCYRYWWNNYVGLSTPVYPVI